MNSLMALVPLLTIVVASLLILLLDVFLKRDNRNYLAFLSLLFLLAGGFACVSFWNRAYSYFQGSLLLDQFALFLSILLLIAVAFILLLSMKYLSLQDMNSGEYYALLLMGLAGMLIMVSSEDLLVIFLGLEVLSISSYVLAGLKRKDEKSSEAAVKYFLLGSFAAAFFVFGLALLFGAAQSTRIPDIIELFRSEDGPGNMALFGVLLLIIGFGFKIALVPFHMWTPDVYQGAPTPITAFFAVGPKAAGFAVFLRFFTENWDLSADTRLLFQTLGALSILTMVVGNLVALRQTNVKRLLAYSSIAHSGYILLAVLARDGASLVFYLTVYLFMNIGAFAALIALNKKGVEYLELDDFAGIGFKYPWIGAAFSLFLFSLAGFPPTGGFLAKFFVFSAAVREGLTSLVVVAVLASLVSVYYYLRIIVYMYMRKPFGEVEIDQENPALYLVLFLCLYGILQLGVFPGNVLVIVREATASLGLF